MNPGEKVEKHDLYITFPGKQNIPEFSSFSGSARTDQLCETHLGTYFRITR